MSKRFSAILATLALVVAMAGPTLGQQKKAPAPAAANTQTAKVTVDAKGFTPSSLELKANVPAKITFTRTSKDTCATAVVVPDYKINKELPLNKPVDVEFTPAKSGDVAFACGMSMFKGKIVVK